MDRRTDDINSNDGYKYYCPNNINSVTQRDRGTDEQMNRRTDDINSTDGYKYYCPNNINSVTQKDRRTDNFI